MWRPKLSTMWLVADGQTMWLVADGQTGREQVGLQEYEQSLMLMT
jgi:hypothetical protein